ncbi:MAG TPA: hypothetical protein VK589_20795 [Chryseolinea sp.]|nr:hypothetical protein [Chryseolinea sp.]
MKTLILFGLTLLLANTAQCQYFQRHVGSHFEMNYLVTTTPLSSFKGAFPVFKQATFALAPDSVDNSKKETSQRTAFKNPSLEKAIQYRREYEKRKIDLSPVLQILYSIYETNYTTGRKLF